jgi:hypothetical protein
MAEGPAVAHIPQSLEDRLRTSTESDAELSAAASDITDRLSDVATYSEPFELRRHQINFTMDSGDLGGEDVRVITFHHIKLVSGTPQSSWDAADISAVYDPFFAFWGEIKDRFPAALKLFRHAMYKAGPDIAPPQLPTWSFDQPTPVAGTGGNSLPPQSAVTVTEKAGSRKFWGRFYLPQPAIAAAGAAGRIDSTVLTDIADAADTMYQAWKSTGHPAVVYRAPLPVRQTAAEERNGTTPGSLAARDGSAWTVDDLQVDDLFDVMRSRRYDRPLLRVQRAIT